MINNETAVKSSIALAERDQAFKNLGATLEEITLGGAKVSLRITKEHTNGHGFCHGGVVFTLADTTFGFACNSYNVKSVAQNCNITYISPVQENDILTAEAIEIAKYGRSAIYDIYIKNQVWEIVAIFRGHSRDIDGHLFDNS